LDSDNSSKRELQTFFVSKDILRVF